MNVEQTLKIVEEALDNMKAHEVITIDVRQITSIADYMVICSGNSSRHVKAIAREVIEQAKHHGVQPLGVQGEEDAEWVLVDLADIVIHIMLPKTRDFYNLEKLWTTEAFSAQKSL